MPWDVTVRIEVTLAVEASNQQSADERVVEDMKRFAAFIDKNAKVELATDVTDKDSIKGAKAYLRGALAYLNKFPD